MRFNQLKQRPTGRLGLGLAALGRPGYINLGHDLDIGADKSVERMADHAHNVLDFAWAQGIRYFDAARSYGLAERFLADWLKLRQIDPAQVTIGSKWGYTYTADWQTALPAGEKHEVKSHTLPVLERQIGESEALLSRYLNLYQIHSATLESGVMENRPVLERLGALREAGYTIGFSVSGPHQGNVIDAGLAVKVAGEPLFGSVQATWNLLERSAGPALQRASEAGLTVIIKEAVANGRLTPRNQNREFAEQMDQLNRLAGRHQTTVDAVALAGVLAQPFVDIVLSGAANQTHLESNLSSRAITLSPAELEKIETIKESPEAYWQTRAALRWN